MASAKRIILVTGGNGGLGFELASQLLADASKHVLLGSRSVEKGEAAVADLQGRGKPGSVELLTLDVADEHSINAAAKTVESKHGRLDALVNNAAIARNDEPLAQKMATCFATNATGPLLMVDVFAPLLRKTLFPKPYVLNVGTAPNPVKVRVDPTSDIYKLKNIVQYSASKLAMNAVSAEQIVGYPEFKVITYGPGFTVSNLGGPGHNSAENGAKPTAEGVAPMVKILDGEKDEAVGKFLYLDKVLEW